MNQERALLMHLYFTIINKIKVLEARSRWDEMNKTKKNNSKIGDLPYLKFGCDDITCVVAFFTFIDDMELIEGIMRWI